MSEALDYILGTHSEELQRLGFQHRVWADDAHRLWRKAGVRAGQQILDFGCGPGFASFDLADIAGLDGKVHGIDKSEVFIHHARQMAESLNRPQLEFSLGEFSQVELPENHFDVVYSRWVFSWLEHVEDAFEMVANSLKPGGRFAIQEYIDWRTFKIYPEHRDVRRMIDACRESWKRMPGQIDIAGTLMDLLSSHGFKITHIAPLERTARPNSLTWQWPTGFLYIYGQQLASMGLITQSDIDAYLEAIPKIEADQGAFLVTPMMLEIVAEKV